MNNEEFFKKTRKIPQPIIDRRHTLLQSWHCYISNRLYSYARQGRKHESRIFRAGYRYKSNNNLIKYSKLIKNKFKEKFKI